MALSADTLRDAIYAQLDAKFGPIPQGSQEVLRDFSEAVAAAVVTHITTDGEAVISVSTGSLQRDSTGAYTSAPSTQRTLPLR